MRKHVRHGDELIDVELWGGFRRGPARAARRVKARLIEDGGAAASEAGHFFRSPAFLEAEGVTHTVEIGGRCRCGCR